MCVCLGCMTRLIWIRRCRSCDQGWCEDRGGDDVVRILIPLWFQLLLCVDIGCGGTGRAQHRQGVVKTRLEVRIDCLVTLEVGLVRGYIRTFFFAEESRYHWALLIERRNLF